MQSKKILVIGGGFTGLSAAKHLVDAGHTVTVVESGEELGGLAASFEMHGEPLEKAYHHLFRTDVDIIELIDSVGASAELEWLDSSVAIYRDRKLWPFMGAFDLLRFKPCSLIGRLRTGMAILRIKHLRNWMGLKDATAMKWMQRQCGKSSLQTIWKPLLHGKFSKHANKVSMAWLWGRLHVRANSREGGNEGEKLGYIKGGFVNLVGKIENYLKAGGASILTHTKVESLRGKDDEGQARAKIDGKWQEFDQILATVSNGVFSRFIDGSSLNSFKAQLGSIEYLGAMCLIFSTDQRLGDYYWVNVNEEDADFLVFIRHTKLVDASRYGGKEIYYVGAYCSQEGGRFLEDQEVIKASWYNYIKKMFPDFDVFRVDQDYLFKFKDAQHIVECGYDQEMLGYQTPMQDVFLSNFTQIFPEDRGTNFAVREGARVARFMEDVTDSKDGKSKR